MYLESDEYAVPYNGFDVLVTATGNVMEVFNGPVRASPYQANKCGMPLDCFAVLKKYFNGLAYVEERCEEAVECRAQEYTILSKHVATTLPLNQLLPINLPPPPPMGWAANSVYGDDNGQATLTSTTTLADRLDMSML